MLRSESPPRQHLPPTSNPFNLCNLWFNSPFPFTKIALLEVVNHDLRPKRLALFDELQMQRMSLIFILSLFRLELDVQPDLVTLINHPAMALHHLTGMEFDNAGNGREGFFFFPRHI